MIVVVTPKNVFLRLLPKRATNKRLTFSGFGDFFGGAFLSCQQLLDSLGLAGHCSRLELFANTDKLRADMIQTEDCNHMIVFV